jgi:hypothetical protein
MKKTLIILFFLGLQVNAQDKTTLELDVFGLSYHTNRDYDYNEVNPGLGVSAVFSSNECLSMVASAGSYKDSFSDQAVYFLVGPRLTIGAEDSFHASVSVQAGYLNGSGKQGLAGIPFITLGYDWFNVGITGDVFSRSETVQVSKNEAVAYTKMVAVFLKFRVLDF